MQGVPRVRWFAPVLVADRYHVMRQLGATRRATVFLARDGRTDELRALKVVDPAVHAPARRDVWQKVSRRG